MPNGKSVWNILSVVLAVKIVRLYTFDSSPRGKSMVSVAAPAVGELFKNRTSRQGIEVCVQVEAGCHLRRTTEKNDSQRVKSLRETLSD